MDQEKFPIFSGVRFSVTVPDAPWEYEEAFVNQIEGTLRAMVNEFDEADFGTISLLKFSTTEATNKGFQWADVCDANSEALNDIYHAIFDENEETKPELDIEPAWNELLVLAQFKIEPQHRSFLLPAFETAISFFAPSDLIIAFIEGEDYYGLGLTTEEWKELGFAKIAGTQIVFRDNCRTNRYKKGRMVEDDEDFDE